MKKYLYTICTIGVLSGVANDAYGMQSTYLSSGTFSEKKPSQIDAMSGDEKSTFRCLLGKMQNNANVSQNRRKNMYYMLYDAIPLGKNKFKEIFFEQFTNLDDIRLLSNYTFAFVKTHDSQAIVMSILQTAISYKQWGIAEFLLNADNELAEMLVTKTKINIRSNRQY